MHPQHQDNLKTGRQGVAKVNGHCLAAWLALVYTILQVGDLLLARQNLVGSILIHPSN